MNEKIVYRKISDMYVRPNTSDDLVIDEAIDYSALFIDVNYSDVLLDIGANIGAVTKLAYSIDNEITIIGYEPDSENVEMCIKNVGRISKIIESSIGTGNGKSILYQSNGSNKGKCSTIERKENDIKKSTPIKKLDFKEQIEKHSATLIKCDIEGGEYDLDFTDINQFIKGIAIEIHKVNNNWEQMKSLYELISSQFTYELGLVPECGNDDWYKMHDCFMVIFLRNP